jgi:hypothetical protein
MIDARNLWYQASSLIAQTLEHLDVEADKLLETKENNNSNQPAQYDGQTLEQVQAELDQYKKMLDDAQMQHVELSKQSRLLMAEKDVELQMLRTTCSSGGQALSDADVESVGENDSNLVRTLVAEKRALSESLLELESRLRDSLSDRNALTALRVLFDSQTIRLENLRDDYLLLKAQFDEKDRERQETVDSLVAEYSRLAAETEISQRASDLRVREVERENETLSTKLHALEHSLSELADRQSSLSPISPPRLHLTTSSPVEDRVINHRDLYDEEILQELKKTKANLVHSQFDLKEKLDEIEKLKHSLTAQTQEAASLVAHTDHQKQLELLQQLAILKEELDTKKLSLSAVESELSSERTKAQFLSSQVETLLTQLQEFQREQVQVQHNAILTEREIISCKEQEIRDLIVERDDVLVELEKKTKLLQNLQQQQQQVQLTKQSLAESELSSKQTTDIKTQSIRIRQLEEKECELLLKLSVLQQECDQLRADVVTLQQSLSDVESERHIDQLSHSELQSVLELKINDLEKELQLIQDRENSSTTVREQEFMQQREMLQIEISSLRTALEKSNMDQEENNTVSIKCFVVLIYHPVDSLFRNMS